MGKIIPFLVYINCILVGVPVAFLGAMWVGHQYGDLAGVAFGLVGLNATAWGMFWGLERA